MHLACVHIRHFPARLEVQRTPAFSGKPLLVVVPGRSGPVVLDRSPEARGVVAGAPLAHALVRHPKAVIVEADLTKYRSSWDAVLDALERVSPVVEDADLGTAYVNITGLARLYGDNVLAELAAAVPAQYRAIVSGATGKFAAFMAASHSTAPVTTVPDNVRAYVAPLSVTLLPTTWALKEKLVGFGLERIGQMADVGIGPMQGEFGPEGARLWQLAMGMDNRPVIPRRHEETLTFVASLPVPTASLSPLLVALEGLVRRAHAPQALGGRAARVAAMGGPVVGASPWQRRVTFREAIAVPDRMFAVLRSHLERTELPGQLEALDLTLSGIVGEAGRQGSLLTDVRRAEQLAEAARQMEATLAVPPPLYFIREVEPWSRFPERRRALVPYAP